MKKLLIICAVLMLCGCASIRQDRKSVYEKELKEGKITRSDYNYLIQGQRELNKMNKDR